MLIVDLEATCWKGYPPKSQTSEIIEIGVCELNLSTLDISNKVSFLVKPLRSKISKYCTELTSITQEMVDESPTYIQAVEMLHQAFKPKKRMWGSWGQYDLKQFNRNSNIYKIPNPMGKNHINLNHIFSIFYGGKIFGMADACRHLNLELEGQHHRAHDDAYNTAKIIQHILQKNKGLL